MTAFDELIDDSQSVKDLQGPAMNDGGQVPGKGLGMIVDEQEVDAAPREFEPDGKFRGSRAEPRSWLEA
jgi:hypothetical protein